MTTRRRFIDSLRRLGLAGTTAPFLPGCGTLRADGPAPAPSAHHDLVVIGSGFGGSLAALRVAYRLQERAAGRNGAPAISLLMLERGTWWTTPTETVQDKQVLTRDFLISKGQATQEWSALSDVRSMIDLAGRCRYTESRPQGLFDFHPIGKRGLFNLRNDGVAVLRASAVGGGSLIYSKILLRPPETLFDDPRWPGAWRGAAGAALRTDLYRWALRGVTVGVETLPPQLDAKGPGRTDTFTGMTGPSQIVLRSPGLAPTSIEVAPATLQRADPDRVIWRIKLANPSRLAADARDGELIDRARIFQTAMAALTPNYGTVNLSINDMDFTPPKPLGRGEAEHANWQKALRKPGTNYCERHGRCNIGCLPGAGQTLNKQLFRAIWGGIDTRGTERRLPEAGECVLRQVAFSLETLTEVTHLEEREGGGWLVHYRQRPASDPAAAPVNVVVSADRVIVAAGSLGSTELLLRSQQRGTLRGLSAKLGDGFSPNGDHIAFLPETKERVNLNFGPVTTSYGQFNANAPRAEGFHQVEDQGIPRSLSPLVGHGMPVIQKLAAGEGIDRYVLALGDALRATHRMFTARPPRSYAATGPTDLSADRPELEEELTTRMMCIVAQGKDAANGRLRLEDDRLRLERTDGKRYHEDPIYDEIRKTLDRLAEQLRPAGSQAKFLSPLAEVKIPLAERAVLTSHPLGGCAMGENVEAGVVDERGRVFRRPEAGGGVHPGLYVADGSTVPTALGVNPALTISAIALRVAEGVVREWGQIPTRGRSAPVPLACKV